MAPGHFAPRVVKVERDYTFNVSVSGNHASGDRISATVTPEGDDVRPFSVTLTPREYGDMRADIAQQGWTKVPTSGTK